MQRIVIALFLLTILSCNSDDEQPTQGQDNWVVFEKKVFDYKLNSMGYADTAYTTTYKYKDGLLQDSAVSFLVYKYNTNKTLAEEQGFQFDSLKRLTEGFTKKYDFNARGSVTGASIFYDKKLVRSENYFYNDSNILYKQTMIVAQIDSTKLGGGTNAEAAVRYDTINVAYNYDNSKKLIGLTYTDPRGKVLRTDVNIYSGNDPLMSHSTNPRGDTLQKVTYEKNGQILHTAIENDSMVVVQNTMNGFQVAQMTILKKKNEKWRSAIVYANGRPKQETLYKSM